MRAALEDAPKIGESLCDACREHFDAGARATSTRSASPYALDPTLVRGLDYYTRTTFEFVGPDEDAQSTICGGGRYDGLIEEIGGPPTPGIGFGAGIERLLLALEREGIDRRAADGSTSSSSSSRRRGSRGACSPMLAELRARGRLVRQRTTPAARSRGS